MTLENNRKEVRSRSRQMNLKIFSIFSLLQEIVDKHRIQIHITGQLVSATDERTFLRQLKLSCYYNSIYRSFYVYEEELVDYEDMLVPACSGLMKFEVQEDPWTNADIKEFELVKEAAKGLKDCEVIDYFFSLVNKQFSRAVSDNKNFLTSSKLNFQFKYSIVFFPGLAPEAHYVNKFPVLVTQVGAEVLEI